jgi:hypothetical protein
MATYNERLAASGGIARLSDSEEQQVLALVSSSVKTRFRKVAIMSYYSE